MLPELIRANRGVDSLSGGVSVREFAACEFPREDIAWVASRTRPSRTPKGSGPTRGFRFRRRSRPSGEAEESDPEGLSEPVSA